MSDVVPTRVHYYERQFLRAEDFTADQAYHLEAHRRHNLAGHSWGILYGLEVVKDEGGGLSVQPGLAIDGFGRELILPAYHPIPPEAFDDQASEMLEIWLFYARRPGESAKAGYAACNGDENLYREKEVAQIVARPPDPNQVSAAGSDRPETRRPLVVAADDLDFNPAQIPPDAPARLWPIYLGRVRRAGDNDYQVDLEGRPYAGLTGEFVRSPSGNALMQVGAEREDDPYRFAVYLNPGQAPPSPLPLSERTPDLAIETDGEIKIFHDTTLYGDLNVDGGAVVLGGGPEYESSKPWRIYHAVLPPDVNAGVPQIEQLRVEMSPPDTSGEVVVGYWSAQQKKFVPCLTIANDCRVTVHGDLELQGNMHVSGEILYVAQTAMAIVDMMSEEIEAGDTDTTSLVAGLLSVKPQVIDAMLETSDDFAQTAAESLIELIDQELSEPGGSESLAQALVAAVMSHEQVQNYLLESLGGVFEKLHSGAPEGESPDDVTPLVVVAAEQDDLTAIKGIGKGRAGNLYAAGIRTFEALAQMSDEQFTKILPKSVQKPDYDSWRREAQERMAGKGGDA